MDETQNENKDIIIPENQEENKVNDANIFKELSGELDFGKEEIEVPIEKVKGREYYLKLSISVLGIINIVLFLFLIFSFGYIQIQNNASYYSKAFLNPFCFIILGDLSEKNTGDDCSSIASLGGDYNDKTIQLKKDISNKLSKISLNLLEIENFMNSQEVSFLLSNKLTRLKILDILNDFDKLKNDFSAGDKKMISCLSIKVNSDNTVDVSCDVYSSSWEKADSVNSLGIVGDSGDRKTSLIEGTSISVAASFLNFIEKHPEYNFQLLEKQKIFDSEVVGDGPYVKKTPIELKMKYNNLKNNLSL